MKRPTKPRAARKAKPKAAPPRKARPTPGPGEIRPRPYSPPLKYGIEGPDAEPVPRPKGKPKPR